MLCKSLFLVIIFSRGVYIQPRDSISRTRLSCEISHIVSALTSIFGASTFYNLMNNLPFLAMHRLYIWWPKSILCLHLEVAPNLIYSINMRDLNALCSWRWNQSFWVMGFTAESALNLGSRHCQAQDTNSGGPQEAAKHQYVSLQVHIDLWSWQLLTQVVSMVRY